MNNGTLGVFLAGPAMLLLLLAALAALLLALTALGGLTRLTALVKQAGVRRMQGRILPLFWGAAAELLIILLAAVLFQVKALGLLGLILLFFGCALAGLGACLAALHGGRALLAAVGADDDGDAVFSFGVGLLLLLLSACVPFIGWTVVLLATAAGVGIVLEALLSRRKEAPQPMPF